MFTLDVHLCFALFGVVMWFMVTCYLCLLILLLSIRIYYFDIRPIFQVLVDRIMSSFVIAILMYLYLRTNPDYCIMKVLQDKDTKHVRAYYQGSRMGICICCWITLTQIVDSQSDFAEITIPKGVVNFHNGWVVCGKRHRWG